MNDSNEQKQIQEDILKNNKERETQFAEATKNELVKELKETSLGDKLMEVAEQEPEKPSKWRKFVNKVKRIFYYI